VQLPCYNSKLEGLKISKDDMVYHALSAFCAADAAITAEGLLGVEYRIAAAKHSNQIFGRLRNSLGPSWPECHPLDFSRNMYTIFLFAAYGVLLPWYNVQRAPYADRRKIVANEPKILQLMAGLLDVGRQYSASFPLALQYIPLGQDGWRFRIWVCHPSKLPGFLQYRQLMQALVITTQLADEAKDLGLLCGHNTSIFDNARAICN
jgi:hypothetical protein